MERTFLSPAEVIEKRDHVLRHATSPGTMNQSQSSPVIIEGTDVYGPMGVSLFPTPLLSNTRIEYCGSRLKCDTCAAHELQLTCSLRQSSLSVAGSK